MHRDLKPEHLSDAQRRQEIEEIYTHTHTYIHRDLKPENLLMLSGDKNSKDYNSVKITDFGEIYTYTYTHTHTQRPQARKSPDAQRRQELKGLQLSQNRGFWVELTTTKRRFVHVYSVWDAGLLGA
jgi:serine/threonine protein kinase